MADRLHTAFGTDHKHHTDDRILTEEALESLLCWWRTTAKDRWGNPMFCPHFRHAGGRCDECIEART